MQSNKTRQELPHGARGRVRRIVMRIPCLRYRPDELIQGVKFKRQALMLADGSEFLLDAMMSGSVGYNC